MATDDLSIVPLASVDEEAVLALVRTGLGAGSVPRSRELWRWKHVDSPFGRSPGLAAVTGGGEVVALRVFSRWRFRGDGGIEEAVRAVDTVTHPEWRRRGLFRRLTGELVDQLSEEGVPFVFNTPNRVSFRGYRELGWTSAGRVSLAVKPVAVRRLLSRRPAVTPSFAELGRPVEELLAEPGLPGFLEFLWQDEPRLHTVRDLPYLGWRYAQVPDVGYRAAWDLLEPSGAVVIARPRIRRGQAEVALAEVLVGPGDESLRRAVALLRRLTANASVAGADYLIAVPSRRAEESRALRRAGFFTLPGLGPRLAVRRLVRGEAQANPLAARSWRWSLGDLELF